MSGSDNFLSRWSRRKQVAAREATSPAPEKLENPPAATEGEQQAAPKPDANQAEPLFDLSKLPSLDSISADTDIRLFMQPGVPATLSRAALRRAWSADPAIRDFVGLSENSWDFTAPDSMTGFGPLLPTDDVKKLLARVFNEAPTEESKAEDAAVTALQQEDKPGAPEGIPVPGAHVSSDEPPASLQTQSSDDPTTALQCSTPIVAEQHDDRSDTANAIGHRRRHGGALPT